jgi:hypothetical protein
MSTYLQLTNVSYHHNIKLGNISFEGVEKLKKLATTLTNKKIPFVKK